MSRRENQQKNLQLMDEARRLHIAGNIDAAEKIFRQLLDSDPNHAEAMHRLGMIMGDRGDLLAAATLMARSVGLVPNVPELHNNLGEVYRKLSRPADARECYINALKLRPQYPEALNNMSLICIEISAPEAAVIMAEKALALAPNIPEFRATYGAALASRRRHADAAQAFARAWQLKPGWNHALTGMLSSLAGSGMPLREVLGHAPPDTPAVVALVAAAGGYLAAARFPQAQEAVEEGLKILPGNFELLANLGSVKHGLGDHRAAIDLARQAMAIQDTPSIRMNLAVALLTVGELEEGFRFYESRFRANRPSDAGAPRPMWTGEPCEGKTILLVHEQGLGDTIQFIRYAPLVAARGAKVLAQVPPGFADLARRISGVAGVLTDEIPRGFDAYIHMASLPFAFRTSLETIPRDVPYLAPDPALVEKWRTRLQPHAGFRVGVTWQGNPSHQNDRNRSIALAAFAPFSLPGVTLFSLQKSAGREQISASGTPPLVDLDGDIRTFSDTAAAIMNLDLVITIDSAVAHLAGALGKPTWLLLSTVIDFRWLLERSDSPWYPSMTLYRQAALGDWGPVIQQMAGDLAALAARSS